MQTKYKKKESPKLSAAFKSETARVNDEDDEDNDNDGDSYDAEGRVDGEEEVYEFDGDADSLAIDINQVENVIEYQFSSASASVSASQSHYDLNKTAFPSGVGPISTPLLRTPLKPEYSGADDAVVSPIAPQAVVEDNQKEESNKEEEEDGNIATLEAIVKEKIASSEAAAAQKTNGLATEVHFELPTDNTLSEVAATDDSAIPLPPVPAAAPTKRSFDAEDTRTTVGAAELISSEDETADSLPPPPPTKPHAIDRRQSVGDRRRFPFLTNDFCHHFFY